MPPATTNSSAHAAPLQASAVEDWTQQINALLQAGEFVEASRRCALSLEADPDGYAPFLALGQLAEIAGDNQKAAEYFSEAIVRNVECGPAFAHLSRIFRKLGQLPHAVRALQVAIGFNAAPPNAGLDLADMLFEMNDTENARQAYQAVLQGNPECSRSRAILKLLQASDGNSQAPGQMPMQTVASPPIPAGWHRVHVTVIAPDNNPHWQGFLKTAEAFAQALHELGIAASIGLNEMIDDGVNIIFGAHLIATQEAADRIPSRSIIFNLEQISGFGLERYPIYRSIVSRFGVWDYSLRNIQKLKDCTGNRNIVHVNIGYSPNLTCIPINVDKTTDVLFFGSLNARRDKVLDELRAAGLRVKHLFNIYGKDLDDEVARSKVVLNVHFYEDSIHEIVRTSYLLANRKAVVSECNANTEIENDIRGAMLAVPYQALAQACMQLVNDETARTRLEAAAFDCISRRSQASFLAKAISDTMPSTC